MGKRLSHYRSPMTYDKITCLFCGRVTFGCGPDTTEHCHVCADEYIKHLQTESKVLLHNVKEKDRLIENAATLNKQLQAELDSTKERIDSFPDEWYTQKGLDAHCELRDRKIKQFQSDLAAYQAGNVPVHEILADNEAMDLELEELQAEILGLRAALLWSGKLDSVTAKDLREFLDALKGGD